MAPVVATTPNAYIDNNSINRQNIFDDLVNLNPQIILTAVRVVGGALGCPPAARRQRFHRGFQWGKR